MRSMLIAATTPVLFVVLMAGAVQTDLNITVALALAYLVASLPPFPLSLLWVRPIAPDLEGQPDETGRTLGWDWLRFHENTYWVDAETASSFRADPAEVELDLGVSGFELDVSPNQETGIPWEEIGGTAMAGASLGWGSLLVLGMLVGLTAAELNIDEAFGVMAVVGVGIVMSQTVVHMCLAFVCRVLARLTHPITLVRVRAQGNLLYVDDHRFTLGHPEQTVELSYSAWGTTLTLRNPDQSVKITGNHAAVCRLAAYAETRDLGTHHAIPQALRTLRSTVPS